MPENARGPSPDDPEDLAEHVADIVSRRIRPQVDLRYTESNSKDLRQWLVGVAVSLTVVVIVGGWTLSNQVSSLQQTVIWLTEALKETRIEVTELRKTIERKP